MKKTGWGLGLATAGMVLFASQAFAGATGSSESSESGGMGSTQTSTKTRSTTRTSKNLQGRVEKFDRDTNTLTLSGTSKKLKVDPGTTQIMKEGERASVEDIKEGQQVRASYSGTGNMVTATMIDIMPSGAEGMGAPGSMQQGTPPSQGTESGGHGTESGGQGTESGGTGGSGGSTY